MSRPPQPLARKSSAAWDRLRPVKTDPLEAIGLVSKGDNRLLDPKTQESYYHKIVARYMQFCTTHSKNLEDAFASLSIGSTTSTASGPAKNLPVPSIRRPENASKFALQHQSYGSVNTQSSPAPADELSIILMALRKLREGLLATSSTAVSPVFSQRVHVFNVRLAILALHPPSYQSSLQYLLSVLHSREHPLPSSELTEMTTYLILDRALRQNDLVGAYTLRSQSKVSFDYESRDVDDILKAVLTNNWVMFWRIHRRVDGHIRAILHWYLELLRKSVLKAIGRSYMKCDATWIVESTAGGMMAWDELVQKEEVGWARDGDTVIIRKPKAKN